MKRIIYMKLAVALALIIMAVYSYADNLFELSETTLWTLNQNE